jgi:ABC-type uncharacterized transport system permease subunit
VQIVIILSGLLYLLWSSPKGKIPYASYLGIIAWLLQAMVCFNSLFDENGWNLDIGNAILLVSWLSVLIVFIFRLTSIWIKIPLVVFVIISLFLVDFNPIAEHHHYQQFSWKMDLHITLSMLAYAILVVATLYAVSLLVHIKKIKNSQFDSNNSLLSIIDEEKKLFQLISLGWLILSTSLLSGMIFVDDFIAQHLGHKVVFSILAWIVFGLIIFGRLTKGWRGEKLIVLTIAGMSLLAMGYLGSKIVLEWII